MEVFSSTFIGEYHTKSLWFVEIVQIMSSEKVLLTYCFLAQRLALHSKTELSFDLFHCVE